MDYSCIYTLTTPGTDIIFNNGIFGHGSNDDLYWIDTIHGLDGPTLRFTGDDVAFGDGGRSHRTFKGPRHPALEGRLIVQSVGESGCQARFNAMEKDLRDALEACLAPATGTLAWTPTGLGAHSLTVSYEVALDVQPADSYRTRTFNFGLYSASADL
jgi:hypothetical protein